MLPVKLVKGKEVELIPLGYMIRCRAMLDGWLDAIHYVEVGVFDPDNLDELFSVLTQLSSSKGESNRVDVDGIISGLVAIWPRDDRGNPAWLHGFAVIYSDGEGRRFKMERE